MSIRTSSPYFKLYAKANIEDRKWKDCLLEAVLLREDLPEMTMYEEACEEYNNKKPEERTEEDYKKLKDLSKVAFEAESKWNEDEFNRRSAKKSQAISDKVKSGLLSLCPYFWGVMAAIFIYYPIVRPTRKVKFFLKWLFTPITKRIDKIEKAVFKTVEIIAVGIGILTVFGIVSLMGYGVYQNKDKIPQIPSAIVSGVKEEYAWHKLQKRRAKEEAVRHAEWEKANQEEVKRQKEWQSSKRKVMWRQTWEDFKSLFWGCVFIVAATIGGILLSAFIYGTALFVSFVAVSIKNRKVWQNFCALWSDTRELVFGMYKAAKERVCPFQTIIDDDNFFEQFSEKKIR